MAGFKDTYPSDHSPEDLWRAINTPLLDPELVSLIHDGVDVRYDALDQEGQIEGGSSIVYLPTDALIEKAPPMFRRFIPTDVEFFVHSMTEHSYGHRRDILMSRKASGGIYRTVEAAGEGSILVVEADLSLDSLGNMFDRPIINALRATVGGSSEATVALVSEILES